jgi:lysyl-tRNA synthetase class 2
MAKRVMGKASFVQIQDMSGRLQLFLQAGALGSTLRSVQGLGRG